MNDNNYRPDWIVLADGGPLPINHIIKQKEPAIYEEIIKSDANNMMTQGKFHIIKSVHYNNECVGVSAYNYKEQVGLILSRIYILRKYRGKGIVKEELKDAEAIMDKLGLTGKNVIIDFPSRHLMKSLVNNGLAFFDGDWIISPDYPLAFCHDEDEKEFVISLFYNFKFGKTFSIYPLGEGKVELIYTAMHDLDMPYYLHDLSKFYKINESWDINNLFKEYAVLSHKYNDGLKALKFD